MRDRCGLVPHRRSDVQAMQSRLGSALQNACRFAASTIAEQSLTDSALSDSDTIR